MSSFHCSSSLPASSFSLPAYLPCEPFKVETEEQNFSHIFDAIKQTEKQANLQNWAITSTILSFLLWAVSLSWTILFLTGGVELFYNGAHKVMFYYDPIGLTVLCLSAFFTLFLLMNSVAYFKIKRLSRPEGCSFMYVFLISLLPLSGSIYYFSIFMGANNWMYTVLYVICCILFGFYSVFLTLKYAH
mgnify:CR=1 FL=1